MSLTLAAALIASADRLLVCAGAGMGVDSGLPDFRGDRGFWRAYPPYERLGLRFVELADPVHFENDPPLAWGFYGHRLALYRSTAPHLGFSVLTRWASEMDTRVFTSNVDGQFQRAGFAEDRVVEVHGSIHHLQCTLPCSDLVWPADQVDIEVDPETMRAVGDLPACPMCGALARPNILMFGDFGWVPDRSQATLDLMTSWLSDNRGRLVVLELGAGTSVPTVRGFAEQAGGHLIRINPREAEIRSTDGISIAMPALAALSELDALVG
ncbi:SIR2 family NAD-dependent protein deacylase [Actinophytocola xanthii]|uniref:protein acetyllysine N-acetyltransferase n=1 Tax=Actinophytocola xanthii TaxID=1912961 RepID=A0A1Q8C0V1_9PSEU|nr:Sir2 family NAD-dependent protein deacetylase [Actinophytocola xanthii]OLF07962.1 NAD-dependent protein deacetylase [Actinophytocola xanthii]